MENDNVKLKNERINKAIQDELARRKQVTANTSAQDALIKKQEVLFERQSDLAKLQIELVEKQKKDIESKLSHENQDKQTRDNLIIKYNQVLNDLQKAINILRDYKLFLSELLNTFIVPHLSDGIKTAIIGIITSFTTTTTPVQAIALINAYILTLPQADQNLYQITVYKNNIQNLLAGLITQIPTSIHEIFNTNIKVGCKAKVNEIEGILNEINQLRNNPTGEYIIVDNIYKEINVGIKIPTFDISNKYIAFNQATYNFIHKIKNIIINGITHTATCIYIARLTNLASYNLDHVESLNTF